MSSVDWEYILYSPRHAEKVDWSPTSLTTGRRYKSLKLKVIWWSKSRQLSCMTLNIPHRNWNHVNYSTMHLFSSTRSFIYIYSSSHQVSNPNIICESSLNCFCKVGHTYWTPFQIWFWALVISVSWARAVLSLQLEPWFKLITSFLDS